MSKNNIDYLENLISILESEDENTSKSPKKIKKKFQSSIIGDITNIISSSQDLILNLNSKFFEENKKRIKIRNFEEDDKRDTPIYNCEYYAEIDQFLISDFLLKEEKVTCIVYNAENAINPEFMKGCFKGQRIFLRKTIPDLSVILPQERVYTCFNNQIYLKSLEVNNVPTYCLYLNMLKDIYKKVSSDVHNLNYNFSQNKFFSSQKTWEEVQNLIEDISVNGFKDPLVFNLYGNSLIPVQCNTRLMAANLLDLPSIPAIIYVSPIGCNINRKPKDFNKEELQEVLGKYIII